MYRTKDRCEFAHNNNSVIQIKDNKKDIMYNNCKDIMNNNCIYVPII